MRAEKNLVLKKWGEEAPYLAEKEGDVKHLPKDITSKLKLKRGGKVFNSVRTAYTKAQK